MSEDTQTRYLQGNPRNPTGKAIFFSENTRRGTIYIVRYDPQFSLDAITTEAGVMCAIDTKPKKETATMTLDEMMQSGQDVIFTGKYDNEYETRSAIHLASGFYRSILLERALEQSKLHETNPETFQIIDPERIPGYLKYNIELPFFYAKQQRNAKLKAEIDKNIETFFAQYPIFDDVIDYVRILSAENYELRERALVLIAEKIKKIKEEDFAQAVELNRTLDLLNRVNKQSVSARTI